MKNVIIYTNKNYNGDQMFRFELFDEKYHYQNGYNLAPFTGIWNPENWIVYYIAEELEFQIPEDVSNFIALQSELHQVNMQREIKENYMNRIKALGYFGEQAELIYKANIAYKLEELNGIKIKCMRMEAEIISLKKDASAIKDGFKSDKDRQKFILKKSKEAEKLNLINEMKKIKAEKKAGCKYVAVRKNYTNKGRTYIGKSVEFRVEKPKTDEYYNIPVRVTLDFAKKILAI